MTALTRRVKAGQCHARICKNPKHP